MKSSKSPMNFEQMLNYSTRVKTNLITI